MVSAYGFLVLGANAFFCWPVLRADFYSVGQDKQRFERTIVMFFVDVPTIIPSSS